MTFDPVLIGPSNSISQFLNSMIDTFFSTIKFLVTDLPRFFTFMPATVVSILAGIIGIVLIVRIASIFL